MGGVLSNPCNGTGPGCLTCSVRYDCGGYEEYLEQLEKKKKK